MGHSGKNVFSNLETIFYNSYFFLRMPCRSFLGMLDIFLCSHTIKIKKTSSLELHHLVQLCC